jgi:hypothetical protein
MNIKGSCYCGEVKFSVISHTPYPYMRCYCSLCRKTSGSGGYGINIMAQADSLSVQGQDKLVFHHGMQHDSETDELIPSQGKRFFCRHCGSSLWASDPRWPELIYPYATAVNTPLPKPPEIVHIMLEFAVPWVEIPSGDGHYHFARYPDESIEQWHKRHGLYDA